MRTNLRVEMLNPSRFYTYAYLREDRTPYYIGKGTKYRIYEKGGRPCSKPKNKSRVIFLKQNLTEEEAFKHEIYMIGVFGRRDLGTGILRNKTNGGDGTSGRVLTEETKKKISISNKGKTGSNGFKGKQHSIEAKTAISNSKRGTIGTFTGKTHSEETRKKISNARKGKPLSEEHKRKVGDAFRGKKITEEHKIKISQSKMGTKHSEETKLKCGIKNKGKKWWTDGIHCKFMIECPGEEWVLGRKIKEDT